MTLTKEELKAALGAKGDHFGGWFNSEEEP